MTTTIPRRVRAADRLRALLDGAAEYRHQRLNDWLLIATPGETRKAWPQVQRIMPGRMPLPPWAR